MFTRQHYKKIAVTLGRMPPSQFSQPMLEELLAMFKADNHRFCPHRFMTAFNQAYKIHWGTLERPTKAFIQDMANWNPHMAQMFAETFGYESI